MSFVVFAGNIDDPDCDDFFVITFIALIAICSIAIVVSFRVISRIKTKIYTFKNGQSTELYRLPLSEPLRRPPQETAYSQLFQEQHQYISEHQPNLTMNPQFMNVPVQISTHFPVSTTDADCK